MEEQRPKKTNLYIGIAICLAVIFVLIFSLIDFLNEILIGTFGLTTYIVLIGIIAYLVLKIKNKLPKWKKSFIILTVLYSSFTLLLLHFVFSLGTFDNSFSNTIEYSYSNITIFGAIGSLILTPLYLLAQTAGTIVLLLACIIVFVCICIDKVYYQTHLKDDVVKKVKEPKIPHSAGSMQVSNKAIIQNESSPSFISMPLTLNAKINEKDRADKEELESSKQLYKSSPKLSSFNETASENNYVKNVEPLETVSTKPQIIIKDATVEEEFNFDTNLNMDISSTFEIQDSPAVNNDILGNTISQSAEKIVPKASVIENKPHNEFQKPSKEKLDEEIKKVNKQKRKYVRPPLELLTTVTTSPNLNEEQYEEKARIIEQKLEEFKINAKCIGVTRGPAITRYEFEMPQGISVNKILQYSNDISMVLESRKAIRIEAPIPGKNAFGIEVPNEKVDTIGLKDLVSSEEFMKHKSPLAFALGKDITNANIYGDIAGLVHTLVAGSTGSGKSVCLNAILISMLYKCSPDDVRIILVDPKFVEFNIYENMPHLLIPHIITEPAQAVNALNWAIEEMERRNRCFGQYYVRSIDEYNDLDEVKSGQEKKMPYIVIVVDELADLMLTTKKEIEDRILRLAQKARSAGIHMILATQRPSVDIITGTIKANLPSRIAFSLTNYVDSKTIIDQGGAEKLLGRGDMLYLPRNLGEPQRLLGPFISQKEVFNIVDFVKKNNDTDFDEEIEKAIFVQKSTTDLFTFDATSDEYFVQAVRVAIEAGAVSTSFIQRKFGVGFQRASKLIDQMEALGYITAPQGANKARKVLITEEEFLEKYGG